MFATSPATAMSAIVQHRQAVLQLNMTESSSRDIHKIGGCYPGAAAVTADAAPAAGGTTVKLGRCMQRLHPHHCELQNGPRMLLASQQHLTYAIVTQLNVIPTMQRREPLRTVNDLATRLLWHDSTCWPKLAKSAANQNLHVTQTLTFPMQA